jgi:hypothetical protein
LDGLMGMGHARRCLPNIGGACINRVLESESHATSALRSSLAA